MGVDIFKPGKGGMWSARGADRAALVSAHHSGHATLHSWELFPQWGPQELALGRVQKTRGLSLSL